MPLMDDTVITIQKHFSFFFTNGTQSLGAVGTYFLVASRLREAESGTTTETANIF